MPIFITTLCIHLAVASALISLCVCALCVHCVCIVCVCVCIVCVCVLQVTAMDEKSSIAQETITQSYTSVPITAKFKADSEADAALWAEEVQKAIDGGA